MTTGTDGLDIDELIASLGKEAEQQHKDIDNAFWYGIYKQN